MCKLSSRAPLALLGSLVLFGCAGDAPKLPHAHDIEPLLVMEEATETSESDCKVGGLSVTYVDDDSEGRGRIRVALASASEEGEVEVEVQGRAPVRARLEADEVLTAARIQDALGSSGEIAVSVHVRLDCGAEADNVFVFEDPIARCGAPSLESIAGREAELYECAERWVNGGLGCGESGYLLGYGAHYARKFYEETRPRMSRRGKAWLDSVLVCLQHDLRDSIGVGSSCEEVRRTAFDQHPACYVESGFCTLSIPDLFQIPATINGRDLFSQDGLRQVLSIAPMCGREYARVFGVWRTSR
jgi:hypothetical protein